MISYTIKRSKRKSVGIYIVPEGRVEVRAPLNMPKEDIEKLVAAKEAWIGKHLDECRQRQEEKAAFTLEYGAMLPVCGKNYPLVAREGEFYGFEKGCFYMPPDLPPEELKYLVALVYKDLAKEILRHKVAYFAPRLGVQPTAVKVNSAQKRWGSCSNKKSVNFSWRLLMAEDAVVNYVVVHELAHIRELNHSKNFWDVVAGVLPDYRQLDDRLKLLQEKLSRENWD